MGVGGGALSITSLIIVGLAVAADCRLIDLYEAKKPGRASCKHPPDTAAAGETAAHVPDILIRGALRCRASAAVTGP